MAARIVGPKFYGWDDDGKPLAYGKLYTYDTQTSNPRPTFTTEAGDVANPNPVILNGEGYAEVHLSGSYNMILKDENDNEIWSSDPVSENVAQEWVNCSVASYDSPSSFIISGDVTSQYDPGRSVRIENGSSFDYSSILSSSFSGGNTVVTISNPIVSVSITGACSSIVGVNSGSITQSLNLSVEFLLNNTAQYPDSVIAKEYYDGSGIGGAIWLKTGNSGIAGTTNFSNGIIIDGSGDERKIQNIEITPAMFGAIADGVASDKEAIEYVFEYSDICLFDRMYYTDDTITLPESTNGRTIKGVNSETSGITTLEGFSGDEVSIDYLSRNQSTIVCQTNDGNLSLVKDVFIYNVDQNEYNGIYRDIVVTGSNNFSAASVMVFPTDTADLASGDFKLRECKPVLYVSHEATYNKLTMSDFIVDGSQSLGSASGDAIRIEYKTHLTAEDSIIRSKIENVTVKAYGGAGLYLDDSFACNFERVYAESELYHGIFIDANSIYAGGYIKESKASTFNNCDVSKAGNKKAAIYSKGDIAVDSLNVRGELGGMSYCVYAGQNQGVYDFNNIIPTIDIKNCNFEGYFINHLAFSTHPRGTIENNTFHLLDANTESIFISAFASSPDDIDVVPNVMINGNKYVENGFIIINDYYVVDNIQSEEVQNLFFAVSDETTNGYTVNNGDYVGRRPFTLMSKSFVNTYKFSDNSSFGEIESFGKDLVELTNTLPQSRDYIEEGVDGDVLTIMAGANNITLNHFSVPFTSSPLGNIVTSSLNDITLDRGEMYEFTKRGTRWYQTDNTVSIIESVFIVNVQTLDISGDIPVGVATYQVDLEIVPGDDLIRFLVVTNGVSGALGGKVVNVINNSSIDPVDFYAFLALDGVSGYLQLKLFNSTGSTIEFDMRIKKV